ncbi:MAG: CHAT domain-containing protein [Myxococcales bacterium]|nr:CHAT domain-containing protein [Myxococcales bacterium]
MESSTAAHPRVEATGYTTSEPTRALGGHRFTLTPTATTGPTLDTVVRVEGIPRLGVQRRAARPKLDPKLLEGKTADDLALLLPTLSPSARLELLAAAHSRIAPVAGPVRDRLLRQGILLAEGLERRQQRTVFRFVAAQSRLQQGDLAGSEAELKAGQQADARDGLALIWMAYAEAQLARQGGDASGAIQLLMDLRAYGERLDETYSIWVADQVALPLLRQSGFVERARGLEAVILANIDELNCRQRESPLTNAGWSRLMARESILSQQASSSNPSFDDDGTTTILKKAQLVAESCNLPTYNTALNLVLDAVQRGDVAAGRRWQTVAHSATPSRQFVAWDGLLSARLQFLANDWANAAATFAKVSAEQGLEPRIQAEALLGLAMSEHALGRPTAEESLNRAAEAVRRLPHAAADLGDAQAHASLTGMWGRIAVDHLAGSGHAEDAFRAAHQALQRLSFAGASPIGRRLTPEDRTTRETLLKQYHAHRALAARKRAELWAAPADTAQSLGREVDEEERKAAEALEGALEYTEPRTGEQPRPPVGGIQVLLQPGLDRWWAITRDAEHTEAVSVPTSTKTVNVIATDLLAALPTDLRRYQEVQLVPVGAMRNVAVHALTYRGSPLGLSVPTTYAAPRQPTPIRAKSNVVLLLGDDRPNLSSSREIQEVALLLGQNGILTERPLLANLTPNTLASLLSRAQKLHFAGHAERSETALRTGLRLRDDLWLTVADVLASTHVPETVVLSGCDTSRHRLEDASWSMTDAFLIAGAHEVVGTDRAVGGELARIVMRHFYESSGSATSRLFDATRAVARAVPDADWAAFRITVPSGRFTVPTSQRTGNSEATVTGGPAPN